MKKAIVISSKDNVATALTDLKENAVVPIGVENEIKKVRLKQKIPFGHKFALRRVEKGEYIIKYGEVIGRATQRIEAGEYVHIHNVESMRGRGDLIRVQFKDSQGLSRL